MSEQDKPVANTEEVICPQCCHQFRAIPEQVQGLLLAAGYEPPFIQEPVKWESVFRAGAAAVPAPGLPALPEPIAKITKDTSGRLWAWGVKDSPYLDTAVSCDYVYTADQLRAAIAADRAARPVLTDEQIDDAIKACPLEGYGLLCEMPADMTGANFKKTVRQWVRAVLAATQGSKP